MLSSWKVRNQTGCNSWQHLFKEEEEEHWKSLNYLIFLALLNKNWNAKRINKPQMQWCLCQGKLARLQSRSLHRGATFPERSIILVLAKFSPWKMEDKKLTNNFCHRRNRDNKQDPAELGENQNETSFEVWTSVFVCSICIPDRTHGPSSGPPKNRSSGVGCCGAKSSGGNIHLKWKVWPVKNMSGTYKH